MAVCGLLESSAQRRPVDVNLIWQDDVDELRQVKGVTPASRTEFDEHRP